MPTALSYEGRIESGLRELGCSGRNFVEVCKQFKVQVSHGGFSQALNDKTHFDNTTGEKLLEVLRKMRHIAKAFPDVPIDWSQHEVIFALVDTVITKLEQETDNVSQY